ncbi:hypothetical protein HOE37_01485 [Candidatus Woesearchaeota archaeon]|jgi:hypothetical protein|nr:hypothetical protein [Candidatus Woesearchaeota archaeon]MBT4110509.1 hypothetical protein [Candidatus Woesearchaeota archaeon]MBT4335967.1 hypothetical protein [Candidatus Woesearchaeota archaeon]MBT4469054.1 hypothetical protein [Candidatus Woesearchaeota archaeon]MBT6744627.1 hypothetical protein [Candidatus Woesearchaeota archaeon]
MDAKNIFTTKRIIFLLIFFVLVLIGRKINFSPVLGAENQFFTLYQFFGPTAGAFLGPIFGGIAVLFAQLADFLIMGKEWTWVSILRFLPMLFAAYYFGMSVKKRNQNWIKVTVPLICIALFIYHPIGRQAWVYSLYWLIPVFAVILPKKVPGKLLFRSLGATFAAHAVGTAIWIWTIPSTVGMWLTLIPITGYERLLFGLGIAGSYVIFNTALDYAVEKWKISFPAQELFLSKKYSLLRLVKS